MKRTLLSLLICFAGFTLVSFAQTVRIQQPDRAPQTMYAVDVLKKALVKQGYTVQEKSAEYLINLTLNKAKAVPELYSIARQGRTLTVAGGDAKGVIYGSLSLVEDLRNGVSLQHIKPRSEQPNLPFRAIKFNLPWDTYRHSYALDLHKETSRDLRFWEAFLDMMAENRFNALTLWNLHPFSFMIRPTNFPEACPFNDRELADWQAFYRGLFRMAKERGIDTYIVNWNIFVSPEFAKAHQVALDNLDHKIHATGDTSEIIRRYTRESVTQVLNEYPDLTGIGFTHGEGMWGMTPQQRQDWFTETILEGMRLANRKAKLIHRVPLSANLALGGSTSVDTEQLTRKAMEKLDFLDGPIWTEIKFNWSHAFSSPRLIKVHGGKLNDTYFKPEPKNYKIAWMARNEDFFCLRWGVPNFIREHIATNTQSYVGGYFVGSECYIPAVDYFTKPGQQVDWTYAFQRQWLFYKLWGRLLYNPATPDAVFTAEFARRYGKGVENLLEASALAGTTPLRLASSFDFTWDFTLYSEGFMALNKNSMDYISVDRQISQPAADPNYVSVLNYVSTLSSGGSFDPAKVTPVKLANQLEQDCKKALALVKDVNTDKNTSLRYEVADIKAWANLGLYFAEKLRGAVALQTYRLKGAETRKEEAVKHLQQALAYWDEVIAITRPLYTDMPLVHYSESNDALRFHWEKLRPDVAKDVEIARKATVMTARKD
ncbi:hypothetical protein GCM10023187_56040 [Nibrella viscosa]|uniref:Beta-hexosaminidase bacterial type N-terminal domain-containing protein n=1 Tax=Nibrella viscosa TaxID=1084524 RepID=A0ABP8L104_9BACT